MKIMSTILVLILLLVGSQSIQLECVYNSLHSSIGSFTFCNIKNISLSHDELDQEVSFNGTDSQKETTREIWFENSNLEFLPVQIFTEFPKLETLRIINSQILPKLSKSFFTGMGKLKILELESCGIEEIPRNTFDDLENLEEISFPHNNLRKLKSHVFRKNKKLRLISYFNNKIEMVNPGIFEHHKNLEVVNLQFNRCINRRFRDLKGNLTDLKQRLENCSEKCRNDGECKRHLDGEVDEDAMDEEHGNEMPEVTISTANPMKSLLQEQTSIILDSISHIQFTIFCMSASILLALTFFIIFAFRFRLEKLFCEKKYLDEMEIRFVNKEDI